MSNFLSIIIPAYNEEATICQILDKICAVELPYGIKKEIIIVDDGSKDSTEQCCLKYIENYPDEKILYKKQLKNQGKGAALKTGIELAQGKWTIIQDADLEYDPEDYIPLLKWMVDKEEKVVYGSRFLNKTNKHSYFSFYIGGRLVSLITNILYGQKLTDEPTCYKLFETAFLKSIPLNCKGFEFCPEVTAKVCKSGIKIHEIPIKYYPRSIDEGKKINWKDGVIALWTLLKYRFKN
ncbi:MAG: glycosyltransferase family 2 protein [Odoribacter sp.]|nr:glycosyltransferase family 2 protein [Odoribacter sp.]